ncbi:DEKNAAC100925 [Brettanomyces naardenensis]|uniref:Serine/threonine-protein phosphatase n=1 Tax=Brettanomyces naardenensis TaxID=13370 RepID=A0A448YH18_BRENA|nr:DEKNAAC100925 [Brettanomyces naardenensis]
MVRIHIDPSAPEAEQNSEKIQRAISKLRNRQLPPVTDPTVYVDDHGKKFVTTERIVTVVEQPESRIPPDEKLYNDGVLDFKFLRSHFLRQGRLSEAQVLAILNSAADVFSAEPSLLHVKCPAVVVGDIHGQYYDLDTMLNLCPDLGSTQYLFLGDYVDRGDCSVEVLLLLYAMKLNFPDSFWMIRGNHESRRMTEYFTFKTECRLKYSLDVYNAALRSFKVMPIAAVLNDQFLCVHGGISKKLRTLEDINDVNRFRYDFPSSGLFCDLVWSDPSPEYDTSKGDREPLFRPNTERNCSYYYSFTALNDFLNRNNLLGVIRGHQPQDSGYRLYRKSETTQFPTLITLFSAPNYCHTYRNKAAALLYDGNTFNIKQFEASETAPYFLPDFMNVFEWSAPFVCEKVIDIMMCLLNVCTEDELSEGTKVAREVEEEEEAEVSSAATPSAVNSLSLIHRKVLSKVNMKAKLAAIGRTARMLNVLREEAEKMEQLRDAKNGKLPRGVLMNGRDELHDHLKSFSDARAADLSNESLPPVQEELDRQEEEKAMRYKQFIEEGSSDVESDDVIL